VVALKETAIEAKHISDAAAREGSSRALTALAPSVQRQVMTAWECFVTGVPLSDLCVSNLVLSSWQRSAQAGVAADGRLAPIAAYGDSFEQLRQNNHDLLWAAKDLLMNSTHLLEYSGSIMLLTDPNGVVLDAAGDRRTLEAAKEIHLVQGGHWLESVVGTNGIGTALAMRRPVQVHAAEHFCQGIKSWTCAAAPVFLPGTEKILGVIDISGPPSTYQGGNLVLAMTAARQIESMLSERASREHVHLLDAYLKFGASATTTATLVLDRNAKLIHSSGNVPGLDLRLGACLPGLEPGCSAQEWARHLPESLRPEWLHPVNVDGVLIGALLVMPKRSRGVITTSPLWSAATHKPERSELDPARDGFGTLLGQSAALRDAVDRAQHLSARRVSVLIQGETGVGKELFARAIHGDAQRSGPFITFNCGATTKELIGSELFGHVRGAYTGATNEGRAGRFELAHGGTLCLDEIGELPLELQPVLLRTLEEGVVCRLGEARPRQVDVRLIAMTNRDLLKEVDAGRFRRDLYHRICVTSIRVPPLRDRAADIELLAEHFNHVLAQRHGLPRRIFTPDIMQLLRAYRWPGNVRELRNVVEGLLLTSDAPTVRYEELPDELRAACAVNSVEAPPARPPPPQTTAPDTADHHHVQSAIRLDDTERQAIVEAVRRSHGNLTQAARTLGVSRSTLYRKVERYHLESIAHATGNPPSQSDTSGWGAI
jgi:sigma-54 dependent transcriptional regulator, acetoin dehydrogenase operon transcriptional activator AcoR